MNNNASASLLRVIDANLNRLGEGLRFLEEIARFVLEDIQMSRILKEFRHRLDTIDPVVKNALLSARDAENDVGTDLCTNLPSRDIIQATLANARRAEEALRVLEEFSKIPGCGLDSALFQSARFQMYDIEKSIISKLSRKERLPCICGLYAIIDTACLAGRDVFALTAEVLAAGVTAVQLRSKATPDASLLRIASEMGNLCRNSNALFIMNDRIDIAIASNAGGVHLGQGDLPVGSAREMLGITKLIGCSVQNVEQALQAVQDGADYLGVGPMLPTRSKTDCVVVDSSLVTQIKQRCQVPVVAIGGIKPDNVEDLLRKGADGLAVISAIMSSESPGTAAVELIRRIEIYREQTH